MFIWSELILLLQLSKCDEYLLEGRTANLVVLDSILFLILVDFFA
jgi:hypothetical protein